ncbi:hypothetical protein OB919_15780 [Halobacteria archaeon AArc-curdl1]|uniref:Uncharacterized protein n=1 Tax=Natronosalvus hydrolyticus TaxID=2979988 RepID=A0AAP2ZCQ5_9EURY|nr:hypothetical protein [Halobacteria archaeon AArc-curdl1]
MAGNQDNEMTDLSNEINSNLKTNLDIAVAQSDYNQREVLSAMIDHCLDDEEAPVTVDLDKIEDELRKYGEQYSKD